MVDGDTLRASSRICIPYMGIVNQGNGDEYAFGPYLLQMALTEQSYSKIIHGLYQAS